MPINKSFLANLKHHPGVYQMIGVKGEILYVGKAKDIKKRVTSYFSKRSQDVKTHTLIKQVIDIECTLTNNENEAVLLECNLIKKHHPRYNVLLRDDKSYPYILITTQDEFARIDFYRGARKKQGLTFGPYPSAYAVRETISLLQKLFRIRTCTNNFFSTRSRPCLLFQIGRCQGPCVGLISKESYQKNIELAILFLKGKNEEVLQMLEQHMEQAAKNLDYESAAQYRDQIMRLRQIQGKQYVASQEGNADVIAVEIQSGSACIQRLSIREGQLLDSRAYFPSIPPYATDEEVVSSFISQHYLSHQSHREAIPKKIIVNIHLSDHAMLQKVLTNIASFKVEIIEAKRGDKKKWLEIASKTAKQSLATHLYKQTNLFERFTAFQQALGIENLPKRIECYDISHTMGEATVASCVVFNQTGPVKSEYRRFNINAIAGGDDYAAMKQVLTRRLKHAEPNSSRFPDVIIIDGGPNQLNAAYEVLNDFNIIDKIKLLAISKGEGRKPGLETLHRKNELPLRLPPDSLALHFIQQVRDEAHRFAITGHRKKRSKTRKQSKLELIPGIGATRRRELLRYFGGIQGLAHASLEELRKVPGISQSLAERIFATLHDATV